MDFLTKEQRSKRMSLIKGKGTKPELRLASMLRKAKVRFRRHRKDLPGKPDFALVDGKVAIFVDGKFWHGKHFEQWSHRLSDFWLSKIENNMSRDKKVSSLLAEKGWVVLRMWEDEVCRKNSDCLIRIAMALQKSDIPKRESPCSSATETSCSTQTTQ